MTEIFNRDRLAAAVGSKFRLTAATESVEVELTEVSELRERRGGKAFSALFLVPAGYNVEQGLYQLEHEELGRADLFLVPVGLGQERLRLEAVFNFLDQE
jgi:hypothetical protein